LIVSLIDNTSVEASFIKLGLYK